MTTPSTNPVDNTQPSGQVAAGSEGTPVGQGQQPAASTNIDAIMAEALRAQGLPYESPDALGKGYKEIQSAFTKSQQENKQLKEQLQQFQAIIQNSQQAQPNTQQLPQGKVYSFDTMSGDDIINAINEDPKGFLGAWGANIREQVKNEISPSLAKVDTLALKHGEFEVAASIQSLNTQYKDLPDHEQILQQAAKLTIEDPRYSNVLPAEGIKLAYQEILAQRVTTPEFLQQLVAQAQAQAQNVSNDKMLGGITTSVPSSVPAQAQFNNDPNKGYVPGSIAAATRIQGLPRVRVV